MRCFIVLWRFTKFFSSFSGHVRGRSSCLRHTLSSPSPALSGLPSQPTVPHTAFGLLPPATTLSSRRTCRLPPGTSLQQRTEAAEPAMMMFCCTDGVSILCTLVPSGGGSPCPFSGPYVLEGYRRTFHFTGLPFQSTPHPPLTPHFTSQESAVADPSDSIRCVFGSIFLPGLRGQDKARNLVNLHPFASYLHLCYARLHFRNATQYVKQQT